MPLLHCHSHFYLPCDSVGYPDPKCFDPRSSGAGPSVSWPPYSSAVFRHGHVPTVYEPRPGVYSLVLSTLLLA